MKPVSLTRSALRGPLFAAASVWMMVCIPTNGDAALSGYGWTVGGAGWSLEQFGPNVTILRSLSPVDAASGATLLLSCSFGSLRLRITLPASLPGRSSEVGPGGALLLREQAAPVGPGLVTLGHFRTPNARQLELQETAEGNGVVKEIVRILQGRRGAIEMLIAFGTSPRPTLGDLVAYVFMPVLGPGDDAMLAHVASACGLRDKPMRK